MNHKREQEIGTGQEGRLCGILLHPTSLPGPYGIGDLGYNAVKFLDFLHLAKQRIWQVLPLGPTGYGDSPYASPSSFAGNPLLISPDLPFDAGFLSEGEMQSIPDFSDDKVDYGRVIPWKSMKQNHPGRIVERAVKGMLPHNALGRSMSRKLHVYVGSEHNHTAQKPEDFDF